MGGAQAIFALAHGTETIEPVDVIAGPGNAWVRRRSGRSAGLVGIDSLAGPSELMLVAGHDTDPEWAALDLCAQAEHGAREPAGRGRGRGGTSSTRSPTATERLAALRPSVADRAAGARPGSRPRATRSTLPTPSPPSTSSCSRRTRSLLAERITTAGCVFAGRCGATAFGDYAAGSNHVLPTGGAGRFSGPLGPGAFRRRISTVEISEAAAASAGPARRRARPRRGIPRPRRVSDDQTMSSDSASRERKTAETQVRLSLDLDGGESRAPRPASASSTTCSTCSPATAQLGLEVEANGDLETGAHHTVEDVGIVLGQALDEALGDRAGIRRYGSAAGADGRVAGRVRDRHLRPAALRLRRRPADDLDRRLRHRAGRGVLPRSSPTRQADPARLGPLRHQRAPHDRGLLQGLRAGAAGGGLD